MYAMPAATCEVLALDSQPDECFLECLLEDVDDVLLAYSVQVPAPAGSPAGQACKTAAQSKPRKHGDIASAEERMSRVRAQNRCESAACSSG